MDKILKLRAVCEFLGQESGLAGSSDPECKFFKEKYTQLSKAIARYDNAPMTNNEITKHAVKKLVDEHRTWAFSEAVESGYVAKVDDSLLYKLSSIGLGNSEAAGYACYWLGCFYDCRRCSELTCDELADSYQCAAYFYGKALEKGYHTEKAKKAYAQACANLGWYDTALYWYPDTQESVLARAYMNHHIRFCREQGLTFPKTKDHIVIFEENQQAKALAEDIVRHSNADGYLRKKMDTLEQKLPLQITELPVLLNRKKLELKKQRKRARRFWWLLFLLITLCAMHGVISGDGEGFQGFSYRLAKMLYAFVRNAYTRGLSMAERMAAFAGEDIDILGYPVGEDFRGSAAGAGFVTHAAITFVWTIIRSFLIERKQGPKYDRFKRKLYDDFGLEEIMTELERIPLPGEETEDTQVSYAIARAWHQALIESAPKFEIPSIYTDDADPEYYRKEEWWLDDYGAFVNALKMITTGQGMLWSGNEAAYWFRTAKYRNDGKYQDYLEIYFSVMFNEAMQKNELQGLGVHLLEAQYKKLKEEIRHKEWEENKRYETENKETESSTSSESGSGALDDLERAMNAWTHGVPGTNKEIIDALHLSGKISGDEANRAKSHNWSPGELLDDNDPYS